MKRFLLVILIIFLTIFSILTLLSINYILHEIPRDSILPTFLVKEYFVKFVESIKPYMVFITVTIGLIALWLAYLKIKLSVESNKIQPKKEWKGNIDNILDEIREEAFINNYIRLRLDKIFDFLFERGMKINSVCTMNVFFKIFLKKSISQLESRSIEFENRNGLYVNDTLSFSYNTVLRVVDEFINKENPVKYLNILRKFHDLYYAEVKKFRHGILNDQYVNNNIRAKIRRFFVSFYQNA